MQYQMGHYLNMAVVQNTMWSDQYQTLSGMIPGLAEKSIHPDAMSPSQSADMQQSDPDCHS